MKLAKKNSTVVKTLLPKQAGAQRLARQYGADLVCVRYRHSLAGLHRYTTIELIVDSAPIASDKLDDLRFSTKIPASDPQLRKKARRLGARWDRTTDRWIMSGQLARQLHLTEHAIRL